MSAKARELARQVALLSPEEKAIVAAEIDDEEAVSADEVEETWTEEIVRRVELLHSGQAETVDGEEELQRLIDKHSR
ncbi:MAG: addiction module protein [Proteobacteria bacterium]|nr:addiction module protein [Pseudomonadota bacterium]